MTPNTLNASHPPLFDLLISHFSNLRKKNNPINQNPENPFFFSAMPLCSPCPAEQNTLALARLLGNEAPSQGRWAVGQTNVPPRANAPRRLGFRSGGADINAEVERGAAARGSSCFRFHCRSKSNSRFWRSAEVNGHCHDPMALSSKRNPSV